MTVGRIKSHDLRFTLPIFEALMRSTSMSLSFCATCPGLSPRIMEMVSLMSAEISPCVLARVIKPVERGGACCGQSADDEQCGGTGQGAAQSRRGWAGGCVDAAASLREVAGDRATLAPGFDVNYLFLLIYLFLFYGLSCHSRGRSLRRFDVYQVKKNDYCDNPHSRMNLFRSVTSLCSCHFHYRVVSGSIG